MCLSDLIGIGIVALRGGDGAGFSEAATLVKHHITHTHAHNHTSQKEAEGDLTSCRRCLGRKGRTRSRGGGWN